MPDVPNTNATNYFLLSQGDGTNSSYWGLASVELPYTYSVSGPLAVASGATNYLPPFFFPVPVGQSVTLVGVYAMVRSGSCTVSIDQNGSAVSGLTSLSVSTTAALTSASVSVSNGDYFQPVITSVSGTPDGLSLSFFFSVTV